MPDQLVDYTWGREHTYCDGVDGPLRHIEFGEPFSDSLRTLLLLAGEASGVALVDGGCIGVTQGPRLETAAEVRRLVRDGCDLVGMTSQPEAALAREAGLDYATLAVVSNPAAGMDDEPISLDQIHATLNRAMMDAQRVLITLWMNLPDD